jgi:hypothetical protein
MPKTRIAREIRRTIQTAPYETLVVTELQDEEIEWEKPAELKKKSEALLNRLIESFQTTHDTECVALGFAKLARYKKKYGSTEYKDPPKVDALDEL